MSRLVAATLLGHRLPRPPPGPYFVEAVLRRATPFVKPKNLDHNYFVKLTNAPYKRFVEIGEGTHTIILEKNRMQFFREVMNFLGEIDPLALN